MPSWHKKLKLLLEIKMSKQYSAIHFRLKSCNDLSNFSLVVNQLPDTDI